MLHSFRFMEANRHLFVKAPRKAQQKVDLETGWPADPFEGTYYDGPFVPPKSCLGPSHEEPKHSPIRGASDDGPAAKKMKIKPEAARRMKLKTAKTA